LVSGLRNVNYISPEEPKRVTVPTSSQSKSSADEHNAIRLQEAEAALAASEARLRRSQELGGAQPYEWDLASNTVLALPGLATLFGVPAGHPVTYEALIARIHPEDRFRVKAAHQQAIRSKGPYEQEYRVVLPDGSVRWILARGEVVDDDQGQPTALAGITLDITRRKQAEIALVETEEFMRRLLSSSDDCIKVLDLDGHLRFMSEGGQRVMEVSEFCQIEGCHWPSFWTGPAAQEVQAAVEAAKAGGTGRFQGFCPTVAGTPRWWDVLVTAIKGPDGRPERLLSISRDITEQKQAEDRMTETAERYRLAARATNDAIWDWDLASDYIQWNEAVQTLFGYAPEEVGASGQWWKEHIHPEHRKHVVQDIHAVIDGKEAHWSAEYRFQKADGTNAAIFDRGYVLRDETGRAVRMIGAMLDITERKRLEEQQVLVSRELHHRVKNTLATVQAVISSTARHAQTISEFRHAVTERITSLAKTHTLLIETNHDGASLRDILMSELEPYADATRQRVRLNGPEIHLSSEMAVAFGMAVHELTTNAAKYGAFSLPTGCVRVDWDLEEQDGEQRLLLEWQEQDGPLVTEPDRQGFGSVLLQRALGRQLGGNVEMTFVPSGLKVRISATLPPPRVKR
jgi:PAS domain S-box-containing protein